MSMVVPMRECRTCACTAFGSAPACTSHVAGSSQCPPIHPAETKLGCSRLDMTREDVVVRHWRTSAQGLKNKVMG